MKKVKVPISTADDLISKLTELKAKAIGNDANLTFYLGSSQVIVTDVKWNGWGDEIHIDLTKTD